MKLFEKRSVTVVPANMFRSNQSAMTPTGLSITPDNALSVTAVFQAIRFLSFMVASLPLITYQKQGEDRRRATDHPLYPILHDAPNPEMTAFDFQSTLWSHVFARGNGLAEIEFDERGQVRYLWPLNPAGVELARNENYELRYLVQLPRTFNGEKRALRPEQVYHLRGLSREGLWGLSVIGMNRNAIGLSKATETFGSAYFGNGAQPGVVLMHPGQLKDEKVQKRILDSWEQAHMGLDNSHRTAILEEGMTVEKIGFNPEDSQFLETRQFQIVEIARMFGIPPHLLFDLSHATFTNIEQQSLEFLIYHLRPWLVSGEQQIKRSLFLERERNQGYYSEYLEDAIVRGDLASRMAAYVSGWGIGTFTINDILRKENMQTIGEAGDKRFVPLNYSVLDENGIPVQTQPKADPAPAPNTPAKNTSRGLDTPAATRPTNELFIKPILLDAADRIMRRESNEFNTASSRYLNKPEKFTAWCEQFYKRDYPEFIQTVLNPLVQANFITLERMRTFIQEYCDQRGSNAEVSDVVPTAEQIASQLAGESYGN